MDSFFLKKCWIWICGVGGRREGLTATIIWFWPCCVWGYWDLVTIKNNLALWKVLGNFSRGYLRFARFSTLMSANWPLMSVNVFFVGYGAPCPLMVLRHSVAVEIVVNGVLRTLWGKFKDAKPIARSASMNEVVWTFLTKIWFGVWTLLNSIFTFLFGRAVYGDIGIKYLYLQYNYRSLVAPFKGAYSEDSVSLQKLSKDEVNKNTWFPLLRRCNDWFSEWYKFTGR